jgi:hypothetical protein
MDTTYYGSGMTPREYELRAMKVDALHREDEAGLIQSRWFDYSALHPAQATYLYADLYKQQTLSFAESYIDIRTAADARAFVPDDIFMSRDMTGMWLARRAADALGMPYEFALQFAEQRALNRLFRHFARPNQLYGEEFEIDLTAAWQESLGRSLRYSRSASFLASAFRGSLVQQRHAAFVMAQIKRRALPHHNLLARMFREDVLSPALVEGHFEETQISAAVAAAARLDGKS